MKLDRDVMIDLETLATSPDAVVLTIAGIRFSSSKNYESITDPFSMDYFYCRVDTESQIDRFIDNETLSWWAKQDQFVCEEAFSPIDRMSISDAMTAFNQWAAGADRYWANGAAFDFPILETCNRDLGLNSPWRYWQAMDARTVYKLVPNYSGPTQSKHHALYDCLNQIQKLNYCLDKLNISKIA